MKTLHALKYLAVFVLILFSSCRTEDEEIIQPNEGEALEATTADLLLRTATNDGSVDNIIDGASCVQVQLPVTILVNGTQLEITNIENLAIIEDIFNESSSDDDTVEIIFPITLIRADFTQVVINNEAELIAEVANCPLPNSDDDDIECIDIQYPLNASVFNLNNELIETVVITSDEDLHDFLEDIDGSTIVTFEFPITLVLFDGTVLQVNNFTELQAAIQQADNQCDEDDDNDPYDDDCDNCTTNNLSTVLTSCENWFIERLERNDNDLEDIYVGYVFNFQTNGTLNVVTNNSSFTGTWSASGTGNNITVAINVSGIPDINTNWNLHEIDQDPGEVKVDLRLGDDRLRFESTCTSGGGGTDLDIILNDGEWRVASYMDDGDDETSDYTGYTINFNENGTVVATNGSNTNNGTWQVLSGGSTLLFNFGAAVPFEEFNDDWDVTLTTATRVELRDVSGGGGGTDILVLEKL